MEFWAFGNGMEWIPAIYALMITKGGREERQEHEREADRTGND